MSGASTEAPPSTTRHRAEYLSIRALAAILGGIGLTRAGRVGAWLGRLGYWPIGIRRRVVERQIAAAFPDWPATEVDRVARASYAHLGRTTIETALLPGRSREAIMAMFESVEGWDLVEERLALGKGLIVVTGHLGNWELGGAYLAARGLHVDAVARHMENPLFEDYLTQTRERIGMHVVFDDEAVRRVPRSLRDGRAVAFLVDQGVLGLSSTWVPFFGRLAKTPRGPAVFALRLGAPVVMGVALRLPSGRYRLAFEAIDSVSTGNRESDVDQIVGDYTSALEQWVRRAPEQYFWHHRRWKHQRPGTPAALGDPS
jgi:Kdo2-lipid IVA lauroyltransferase/acyltransferase